MFAIIRFLFNLIILGKIRQEPKHDPCGFVHSFNDPRVSAPFMLGDISVSSAYGGHKAYFTYGRRCSVPGCTHVQQRTETVECAPHATADEAVRATTQLWSSIQDKAASEVRATVKCHHSVHLRDPFVIAEDYVKSRGSVDPSDDVTPKVYFGVVVIKRICPNCYEEFSHKFKTEEYDKHEDAVVALAKLVRLLDVCLVRNLSLDIPERVS